MELLDRFLLIRRLATRPHWQTWWAEDCKKLEHVIIKILPLSFFPDRVEPRRLRASAENLAMVRGQYVSSLRGLYINKSAERVLIVHNAVPGENFAQRHLRDEGVRLDGAAAGQILRKICHGLLNIHQAGLAHGNLHPNQIIITPQGEPVLTDTLIARELWHMVITRHQGDRPPDYDHRLTGYLTPDLLTRKPAQKEDIHFLCQFIYRWLTTASPATRGEHYEPLAVKRAALAPSAKPIAEEWGRLIDDVLHPEEERGPLDSGEFFARLNSLSGWNDPILRGHRPTPSAEKRSAANTVESTADTAGDTQSAGGKAASPVGQSRADSRAPEFNIKRPGVFHDRRFQVVLAIILLLLATWGGWVIFNDPGASPAPEPESVEPQE
jgi:serine/threonine-protein kinase